LIADLFRLGNIRVLLNEGLPVDLQGDRSGWPESMTQWSDWKICR